MPWFRSIGPTRGLSSESSGLRRRGDGVDNTGGREFFEGLGLATFFNAPRAAPGVDAVHTPHGRSKERSPCRIQWLLAWKLDVDGLKRTSCREPMAAGGSNYPARGSGSTRSLGPERLVVSKIRSATSTVGPCILHAANATCLYTHAYLARTEHPRAIQAYASTYSQARQLPTS